MSLSGGRHSPLHAGESLLVDLSQYSVPRRVNRRGGSATWTFAIRFTDILAGQHGCEPWITEYLGYKLPISSACSKCGEHRNKRCDIAMPHRHDRHEGSQHMRTPGGLASIGRQKIMIKEVAGDILLSGAQAIAHVVAPNDHFDSGLAAGRCASAGTALVKDFIANLFARPTMGLPPAAVRRCDERRGRTPARLHDLMTGSFGDKRLPLTASEAAHGDHAGGSGRTRSACANCGSSSRVRASCGRFAWSASASSASGLAARL